MVKLYAIVKAIRYPNIEVVHAPPYDFSLRGSGGKIDIYNVIRGAFYPTRELAEAACREAEKHNPVVLGFKVVEYRPREE